MDAIRRCMTEAHTDRKVCVFFMFNNWKLYLYYNGILIKKIRIKEDEAPSENSYVVKVYGKKHIFGSNNVTVILRPVELLKTDERKKETHWGAIHERGVDNV